MEQPSKYVIFVIAEQQYGLPLEAVVRVVRMVRITHVPHTPAGTLGVINIQGRVIPVLSFRRWLGLPDQEPELSDRLLIVETPRHPLALIVDDVLGVMETSTENSVPADTSVVGTSVDSLVKLETGGAFILLHSVEQLLAGDQELPCALAGSGASPATEQRPEP